MEFLGLTDARGIALPLAGQDRTPTGIRLAVAAEHRGLLRLAAVRAASSWPLGIARAEREVSLQFEVVVHPRYTLPFQGRRRGTREPAGASSNRGPGEEFLGLREYQHGDSQRSVHWPTTARTGRMMVIETAREASNSSAYVVDVEAGVGRSTELAVQLAASLAAGNVAEGVPLTMAIPGQPQPVQRWPEVLAALATAHAGNPLPGRLSPGGVEITASGENVTVAQGDRVRVIDATTDLDAALEAWQAG